MGPKKPYKNSWIQHERQTLEVVHRQFLGVHGILAKQYQREASFLCDRIGATTPPWFQTSTSTICDLENFSPAWIAEAAMCPYVCKLIGSPVLWQHTRRYLKDDGDDAEISPRRSRVLHHLIWQDRFQRPIGRS